MTKDSQLSVAAQLLLDGVTANTKITISMLHNLGRCMTDLSAAAEAMSKSMREFNPYFKKGDT